MLKRTTIVLVTALLGVVLGIVPLGEAKAQTNATTVYTQPGDHLVNGRYWQTDCEKYSTTVVRCTTDIWGTKVAKVGGSYVAVYVL